jgi:hypothetical protein
MQGPQATPTLPSFRVLHYLMSSHVRQWDETISPDERFALIVESNFEPQQQC